MAYLVTHLYAGGTEEKYRAVFAAAHPVAGLRPGQTYHAAWPTEGGRIIVAVRDSEEAFDTYVTESLPPHTRQAVGRIHRTTPGAGRRVRQPRYGVSAC
jgi:hypothetical protein